MLGAAPSRVQPPRKWVAHDFWVLVPKHWCPRGKAQRLHLFFFPKWTMAEHGELGSHGCPSPESQSRPRASHPGTSSHLTPKIASTGCFLCFRIIFFSSFGSWQEPSRTVPYRGCHRLPAGGSARDGVRTMLHLVPEGYCRHFYNIYNRTGHSVLQRFQKT